MRQSNIQEWRLRCGNAAARRRAKKPANGENLDLSSAISHSQELAQFVLITHLQSCANAERASRGWSGKHEPNEETMNITRIAKLTVLGAVAAAALGASPAHAGVDAAAAEATARRNGCLKCHAVDKKKDGPSYKEVAAKYRGKSNAEARLYTHITTGEIAKFPDGHEEEHKIIKTKDQAEIRNLISWILSL